MDNSAGNRAGIAREPTRWELICDVCFRTITVFTALLVVVLVVYIVFQITVPAMPAIRAYGLHFLAGQKWDPNADPNNRNGDPDKAKGALDKANGDPDDSPDNRGVYGILPQIWGTLYSSILALFFGSILGISVAIFLSERFLSNAAFQFLKLFGLQFHPIWGRLPDNLDMMLKNLVELLAAIPSVVYGLWGLAVVIPQIRPLCDWLHAHLSQIPLFGDSLGYGGMLPAAIVLAIMIVPTISAISRDALMNVPPRLREAAYGLGATRWEALISVILPTARTGIIGAILLAFGRALGETMALAMLAGNNGRVSVSLFATGDTLAALLANKFSEAGSTPISVAVLMYAALVLLAITLVVNILGALVLEKGSRSTKGVR